MTYPKIKVTPPGPKAMAIVDRDAAVISPSFGRAYPLVVESAEGNIVTDVDGNEYIDMNAGLAVCSVGHGHPIVKRAMKDQIDKFIHYSYTDFFYEDYVQLGEELDKIVPIEGPTKTFYGNSGAEAIEAAMKVARWHTGRQGYIAYIGSFHGRTLGAVSLTASKPYQRRKFAPLIPGVHHVPYPYCYRCPFNLEEKSCDMACVDYIDDYLFHKYVAPEEVSMLMVEPIQGEGGYVVPPKAYFPKLKKLLDEHGILFAVDEVQSGVGRTGKWFAVEHWDVKPDIVVGAKGIAAGMPLGYMTSKAEIQNWTPGSHASTFGGNPVSCAAAMAVLDIIKTEDLLKNAEVEGGYIKKRLEEMMETHPMIGDVRGKGLMVGVEIIKDKDSKEVAPNETEEIMMDCFRKGLAIVNCGVNVIRWMPPLTITRDLIDPSLEIFEKALSKIEAA
ncbi:acetyl ornithine aminotransferase family protein [Candidatus Bathyarchaeota archaeon]|jgi:4-aminobutyrate aminotransferase|nr:acetyl ornithine aminotransferase family protein [Candidatus Bathyarchaeota archaeon]MBT4320750.1 acetyl ornithine aminotransferase family protein [Candidatus Bathyarchaeota archaeon]MBT4424311.1 acetyl ornithine aminotransferase family protein [Candidatus Bathyarchaeota archaeon]MBT7187768.1 acetyl ornithine aminotransferase family protein [Candidatus Bathyarchaeota archaeon]MBT7347344.1 acetyl ornithine aminotransferase family protein [Candidatus Bathyarchaeota archaeon]